MARLDANYDVENFLGAFACGSTVAMAALTAAMARVGARVGPRYVRAAQIPLAAMSVALGLFWLARPG